MRRVRTVILNAATILSLVLAMGSIALCARNRHGCETVGFNRQSWNNDRSYQSEGLYLTAGQGNLYFLRMAWGYDYAQLEQAAVFDGPLDQTAFRASTPDGWSFIHRRGNTMTNVNLPTEWHGFGWHRESASSLAQWNTEAGFSVPAWLMAIFLAIPAAISLATLRRKRAQQRATAAGMCAQCGYSLRGNVSGVCPECGTPVP